MNRAAVIAKPAASTAPLLDWLWVAIGLAALYVPTYLDLAQTFWRGQRGASGAVILAFVLWLLWRDRALFNNTVEPGYRPIGSVLFATGLLLYVLGRSQSFLQLEVFSQIPLLLGATDLLFGRAGLKRLWFPIGFLVFLVPVPGSLLDELLLPLKHSVSHLVDALLYSAGYPIARNGVMLMIGPYQLLIADACSGLNSMVALSGIGLLYTYVAGHSSKLVNAALLLSAIPIAFVANIARVIALVLITYYAGDTAGRTFHDYAAYLEIALAFGAFYALDRVLSLVYARAQRGATAA